MRWRKPNAQSGRMYSGFLRCCAAQENHWVACAMVSSRFRLIIGGNDRLANRKARQNDFNVDLKDSDSPTSELSLGKWLVISIGLGMERSREFWLAE